MSTARLGNPMSSRRKRLPLLVSGLAALVIAAGLILAAFEMNLTFFFTDTAKSGAVTFRGSLPDLFREGKGVVVQGRLDADGVFRAEEVLAEHDQNYTPLEARQAVEQARQTARTAGQ
jgi:cytochrome c-type biogenesis protein CcmE